MCMCLSLDFSVRYIHLSCIHYFQARDAEARGDEASRRINAHFALYFNILSAIWGLAVISTIIIITAVYSNNNVDD